MTPSVPAVLAVFAVTLVLLSLFVGVSAYYSQLPEMFNHPEPGSIYVVNVDRYEGVVVLANRYSKPVLAVFTLYLTQQSLPPEQRVVRFTAWLQPGVTHVHLAPHVARLTGTYSPTHVDWGNSNIVVGGVTLRFERGSGLRNTNPQPVYKHYTFTGTGLHSMDDVGYATVFHGEPHDVLRVESSQTTRMGYRRRFDLNSVTWVFVYTYNLTGEICLYYNRTLYNACGYYFYGICVPYDLVYRDDLKTETYVLYGDWYRCGRDDVTMLHYGTEVSLASSYELNTYAFVNLYPTLHPSISIEDTTSHIASRTGFGDWYTTYNCTYTYEEYYSTASLEYGTKCCPYCGTEFCVEERICRENRTRTRYRTGNPCVENLGSGWKCLYLSWYLMYNVTRSELVRVEQRGNGRVRIFYELLLTYNYTHWKDPHDSDDYIWIPISGSTRFTPPRVSGFVSVGYNETLESASAGYVVYVNYFDVKVWTPAGNPFSPVMSWWVSSGEVPATLHPAMQVPSGGSSSARTYVMSAEPSFTFGYYTVSPVKLRKCNPHYDPRTGTWRCNDTVYVRITLEIEVVLQTKFTVRTRY